MQRTDVNCAAIWRILLTFLTISRVAGRFQRFREEPRDVTLKVGQQHELRCSVENLSGPVQWLRDSFGLGPGPVFDGYPRYKIIHPPHTGEYHLSISDVQLEDDAMFECQVGATEHSEGMQSHRAKVSVNVPPDSVSIDGAPRVYVISGQSTDLVCRAANGKPAPTVTWERAERRMIDGFRNQTIVKADGKRTDSVGRLTIVPNKTDQGSQFVCRVTSPAMDDERTTAVTLEVQYKAEISMTASRKEQTIKEYESISFECKATANPSNITWKWFDENDLIPNENSGHFYLRSVKRNWHKRRVVCEATNSVGRSREQFLFNVEYGPRFVSGAENPSADPGDAVELSCGVDSNPAATVVWHRVGSAAPLGQGPTLVIPSVNEADFAAFTCTASVPGYEDISRQIHIRKKGPPRITSDWVQSAEYGENGALECFVEGVPKPDQIVWKRNGEEIHFDNRGRYRVRNEDDANGRRSVIEIIEVNEEDFGEFVCYAQNSYGHDQITIKYTRKESIPLAYILGGAAGGVVFIVVVCAIVFVVWRHRRSRDSESSSSRSSEDSVKKANNSPNIKVEYSTESTVDGWRDSLPEDQFPRYSAEYDELRYPTKESAYSGHVSGFLDPVNEYEVHPRARSPYFHPGHFDNVYGTYPRGMTNAYAPRMDPTYVPLYGSETYATYGRPRRRDFSPAPFAPVLPQPPPPASPTDSRLSTNV